MRLYVGIVLPGILLLGLAGSSSRVSAQEEPNPSVNDHEGGSVEVFFRSFLGSAAGATTGLLVGNVCNDRGGCLFSGGDDPGLAEAVLVGFSASSIGATVGVCLGRAGGCWKDAGPKSFLAGVGGLLGAGVGALMTEWSGGGNLTVPVIAGYSLGQALMLTWLLD